MVDVKIRVIGEDRASRELAKIDKSAKGLGGTLKGMLGGAAEATKAIAGIGLAMKQIFDFGKAGAEIELANIKLDRLALTIGTTGDALRTELKPAINGLMSDAEAVQLASDLMSLGLAKTEDTAVRLTRVAAGLGMNMNQLVLTLTNQTTMRFDALGVSVDGFNDRLQALKDSGMDVNDAFTEAFLQQAEGQIERVGDVSDTTMGQFMRMEASMKNAGDAIKSRLTPIIADAADAIYLLLEYHNLLMDALDKHSEEVAQTADSYEDYVDQQMAAAVASKLLTQREADVWKASILAGKGVEGLSDHLEQSSGDAVSAAIAADAYSEKINGLAEEVSMMTEYEYNLSRGLYDQVNAWGSVGMATEEARRALDEELDAAQRAGETLPKLVSGNKELSQSSLTASQNTHKLGQALDGAASAAQAAAEGMGRYFDMFNQSMTDMEMADKVQGAFADHLVDLALSGELSTEQLDGLKGVLSEIDPVAATALDQALALSQGIDAMTAAALETGDWSVFTQGLDYILSIEPTALKTPLVSGAEGIEALGLSAKEHQTAMDAYIAGLAAGQPPVTAMGDALEKVGIVGPDALGIMGKLITDLEGTHIPADGLLERLYELVEQPWNVEVNVTYNDPGFTGGGGGGGGTKPPIVVDPNSMAPAPGMAIRGASGLDFTVPPGFPNDTFGPIWAQSGEHVKVTPAGEKGSGPVINEIHHHHYHTEAAVAVGEAVHGAKHREWLRQYT